MSEAKLVLKHWDAELGDWIDLLNIQRYPNDDIICGDTPSFSPFALMLPCACVFQSDFDEDGFLTALDLAAMIDVLFAGQPDVRDPDCPSPRADFDCDSFSTALDLASLIDHLFAGGDAPCEPCGYPLDN